MSQFANNFDQENLHARPAVSGKNSGALQSRNGRAVLGEISQNVSHRRQPLRAAKQPEKSSFTIFCDENAGVSAVKPVQSKSSHQDKENVFQTRKQESAPPTRQPLGSVKVVENFNDSSDSMETDSAPWFLTPTSRLRSSGEFLLWVNTSQSLLTCSLLPSMPRISTTTCASLRSRTCPSRTT